MHFQQKYSSFIALGAIMDTQILRIIINLLILSQAKKEHLNKLKALSTAVSKYTSATVRATMI